MTDHDEPPGAPHLRTFLVVVDESEEMRAALRFACKRARNTGGMVALLKIIEPPEFQHFAGIGRIMEEEARQSAEQTLNALAAEVNQVSGHVPTLFVRQGKATDEVIALIDEAPDISILVLAAGTGQEGPGPLVTSLSGRLAGSLRVPVTVVPGSLSDEDIDALA